MALVFGLSSKRKPTAMFMNNIYSKYRVNGSGLTTWRCVHYSKYHCRAQIVTTENRLIHNQAPIHTHGVINTTTLASVRTSENELNSKTGEKNTISYNSDTAIKTMPQIIYRNDEHSSQFYSNKESSAEEDEKELIERLYAKFNEYAEVDNKMSLKPPLACNARAYEECGRNSYPLHISAENNNVSTHRQAASAQKNVRKNLLSNPSTRLASKKMKRSIKAKTKWVNY